MTENLIALERGADELLLADAFHLRPLYVQRGRERVKRLLAAASPMRSLAELLTAFPEDAALIRLLRDHGILSDTPFNRGECQRPGPAAAPVRPRDLVTLYLLVGESCNLTCIYCLNGPQTYRRDNRAGMSPAVAWRSVALCLEELEPGGCLEVAFFGGEPLLHWPVVKEVIRGCEDRLKPAHPGKRIHYHLTSNLTLCPPDLTDWVTHYNITVLCGVDGPPEIHDRCRTYPGGGPSHARSAATIERLVRAGARVTLRATITSANHDCLDRVAAHHAELGAAASLFVPVRPVNSDRDFFPEAILPDPDQIIAAARQLGRRGGTRKANLFPFNDFSGEIRPGIRHVVACAAPAGGTYVVRVNGDVYPCIYLVGQEHYRLGNVTGRLDRRPLDDMHQALHVDHREGCRACAWRYACGGGCPVLNLARLRGAEGRPRVVEYSRRITCDLSRALLADSLWDLADQARDAGPAPGESQAHNGALSGCRA